MKLATLIAFLCLCSIAFGQNIKFDPNIKYTQEELDTLLYDWYTLLDDIEEYKKIVQHSNLNGMSIYYGKKARIAMNADQLDSAIYFVDKSIEAYELNPRILEEQQLTTAHIIKASALWTQKKHAESIVSYQNALELTKKYPYQWTSYIISGIAENHLELGNDSLALNYFMEISSDTLYMSQDRPAVVNSTSIGSIYLEYEKFNLAKEYFFRALHRSKIGAFKENEHSIHYSLSNIYFEALNQDSALYHNQKGNEAFELYGGGAYEKADDFYQKGLATDQIYKGKYKEGILSLERLIEKALQTDQVFNKNDRIFYTACYDLLSKAYVATSNTTKLVANLEKKNTFLKKSFQHQLDGELQKLEVTFNAKQQEAEIEQLQTLNEQKNTIISQQNLIAYGLGAVFLLFGVLSIIIWKQRKLNQNYQIENLKQRLLRSQMNPHFMFNALSNINGMVQNNSNLTIPYVNNLASLFRLVLQNSREELVDFDDEISALKSYLELESNFSDSFDYDIISNINSEFISVPPMLIQPFVENAIQHGIKNMETKGRVEIHITQVEKTKLLHCIIKDNGRGFNPAKKEHKGKTHHSLSSDIARERLEILRQKFKQNSRFDIQSEQGKGTVINLYIPFIED